MIDSIKGTYLSNFFESVVLYKGLLYRNAESAFQASKCAEPKDRLQFQPLLGAEAKALGRRITLREDWNKIKLNTMYEILEAKFEGNPDLLAKLIATGDEEIVEGNTWNDTYWGKCNGKGENQLGILLMTIREVKK